MILGVGSRELGVGSRELGLLGVWETDGRVCIIPTHPQMPRSDSFVFPYIDLSVIARFCRMLIGLLSGSDCSILSHGRKGMEYFMLFFVSLTACQRNVEMFRLNNYLRCRHVNEKKIKCLFMRVYMISFCAFQNHGCPI